MAYQKWQGALFTDQNKIGWLGSDLVCEACAWCHSWVAPPGHPPPADGKRGICLRHFSHFWSEDDGYHYWNKADKPSILMWLRSPKAGAWFASIADSGQKHIIPQTSMNPPGSNPGVAQFEERRVEIGDWSLVDSMTELLTDGVTKEELTTGEFRRRSMVDHGAEILAFEREWGSVRGGNWYALAIWLAQRGEKDD